MEPELPLALAEAILKEEFDTEFQRHYLQKMRKKLGLIRVEKEEDGTLVAKLLETMHLTGEPQNPVTVGKYLVFSKLSGTESSPSSQTDILSALTTLHLPSWYPRCNFCEPDHSVEKLHGLTCDWLISFHRRSLGSSTLQHVSELTSIFNADYLVV